MLRRVSLEMEANEQSSGRHCPYQGTVQHCQQLPGWCWLAAAHCQTHGCAPRNPAALMRLFIEATPMGAHLRTIKLHGCQHPYPGGGQGASSTARPCCCSCLLAEVCQGVCSNRPGVLRIEAVLAQTLLQLSNPVLAVMVEGQAVPHQLLRT